MAYIVIVVQNSPIRHLILHHTNIIGTAITIDCATKNDLALVWSEINELEGKRIYNHDDHEGQIFHDALHTDMMAVMNSNRYSTLTDYHQHWVSISRKGQALENQDCFSLLQKLMKKKWVSSKEVMRVMAIAYNLDA